MQKLAAIGECMIEFAPQPNQLFSLGYAGDTLNVALYFARYKGQVDYFTALGCDTFSDTMITQWQDEGIGTQHVQRISGRMPPLYVIETDSRGERTFHYWREQSPARELFDLTPALLNQLVQ